MTLVYLGVGSNQGDRREYLRTAAQMLYPAVQIRRSSRLYLTEPWGYKEQPSFYNLVWEAETLLPPLSLLKLLKDIEVRIGRVKTLRYGPRVIDLDILLYGDLCFESKELTIPHLQIPNRRFVLQPLCDLIPDGIDPVSGQKWHQVLAQAPQDEVKPMDEPFLFGPTTFRWGLRSYIMGIVNLTPDSFSGDGLAQSSTGTIDKVLQQCSDFLNTGADILDLGAESTRPGHLSITTDEELHRLLPPLKEVRKAFPQAVLSVDSGKAQVVQAALESGIDWINDTGNMNDKAMNAVCAGSSKPVILMRSRPLSISDTESIKPEKLIERVRQELIQFMETMLASGIRRENIILDPGLGFGTTKDQDLEIVRHLDQISDICCPVLLGPSRKSFIGVYLQAETESRLAGTAAVVCAAIQKRADIIRVHDVKFMKELAFLFDQLKQ